MIGGGGGGAKGMLAPSQIIVEGGGLAPSSPLPGCLKMRARQLCRGLSPIIDYLHRICIGFFSSGDNLCR